MTNLVPADQIEAIVGVGRHPTIHFARAVAAERTVYILHPQECRDAFEDPRECPWSQALDRGIDDSDWPKDQTVSVRVRNGRLEWWPLRPSQRASGAQ